ncbi:MAG: hypothetical protein ND866_16615 [Pyrinomonadaceae bacterium]|nr:hypothetical protein [Pyrinomonadaceae bacterium]
MKANFIEAVKRDVIDFNYGGKSKRLFDNITISDAKWIGDLLAQLSEEQIKDAFRAANYLPEEVERLSLVLRQRVDDLNTFQRR